MIDIIRDIYVARRLSDRALYCGITTPTIRAERQRARINQLGLADKPFKRGETWAQAFERWHGDRL
jgi:hypothetical protein